MSNLNFTEEFKRDAVRQITERGYPVAEASQRLGVSQHSLYEWKKTFGTSNAKASDEASDEADEVRRLKKELARVSEERDILKKRPRTSPGMQSEARFHCPASPEVLGADDVSASPCAPERALRLAEEPIEQAGQ